MRMEIHAALFVRWNVNDYVRVMTVVPSAFAQVGLAAVQSMLMTVTMVM